MPSRDFARRLLGSGDVLGIVEIDDRAGATLAEEIVTGEERAVRYQVELADLLIEGHAREQVLDLASGMIGGESGRAGRERGRQEQCEKRTKHGSL